MRSSFLAQRLATSQPDRMQMQVAAGRALHRDVEVLAQQDGWVAISGPLAAGDLVVANGVDHVKDDQAVITN